MAVLQECPFCHQKRSLRNKRCTCGADLDQLKKTNKVRFWLDFRDDEGKMRIPVKVATCFDSKRPAVPIETGHPI